MRAQPIADGVAVDLEKFRLRNFVRELTKIGEIEMHEEPVALSDLSAVIEATPKATHFTRVGAEQYEMVAAVSGSRKRLAAALGVAEREIAHEFMRRMSNPQPVVEVPSRHAPVHQVVRKGDDVDLTRLCRSMSSTSSMAAPTSRRRSTSPPIRRPARPTSAAGD